MDFAILIFGSRFLTLKAQKVRSLRSFKTLLQSYRVREYFIFLYPNIPKGSLRDLKTPQTPQIQNTPKTMPFTPDQLQQLGYVLQPDGSYSAPGAARSTHYAKPKLDPKTQAHPHGLQNPVTQPTAPQALDRGPQGEGGRKACAVGGAPRYRLIVTRYSSRPLDADNLAGGCKPLIDAIRRAGLIPDDDPKTVILEFAQHGCLKADERTEVEVFERAPSPSKESFLGAPPAVGRSLGVSA